MGSTVNVSADFRPRRCSTLEYLFEFRQGFEEIDDEAVFGNLEDQRLLVLFHGDDHLAILHAGYMLDRTRDTDGDVELRGDDLDRIPMDYGADDEVKAGGAEGLALE